MKWLSLIPLVKLLIISEKFGSVDMCLATSHGRGPAVASTTVVPITTTSSSSTTSSTTTTTVPVSTTTSTSSTTTTTVPSTTTSSATTTTVPSTTTSSTTTTTVPPTTTSTTTTTTVPPTTTSTTTTTTVPPTTTSSTTTTTTTTLPTTTTTMMIPICSLDSLTFGKGDNFQPQVDIDVTYSNLVANIIPGTMDMQSLSTMQISCTAIAGYNAYMIFDVFNQPAENQGFPQSVTVNAQCNSADMIWYYVLVLNGVTYTRVINSITCQQAPN